MGERVIVEAWAPGRINLIGEHTDYNGGLALPMAINRGTHVEMRSIDVPEIRLRSAQIDAPEVVVSISEIMRAEMPLWARYVVGTLWVLGIEDRGRGLDITINGDLPLGSGLSSSASLEVGVAYAACKLLKLDLGAGQMELDPLIRTVSVW